MSSVDLPTILVEVTSDVICPWCYVGKRRLEKAMRLARARLSLHIQVRWHPFFLDPSLPEEGVDRRERLEQKFGAERLNRVLTILDAVGKEEGIEFRHGGKVSHTLNAHRLAEWAFCEHGHEAQNAVMENLFKAYFEEEKNIGDVSVLAEVASASSLDGAVARRMLEGDDFTEQVCDSARRNSERQDIPGVPYFVFDNRHEACGAQDVEHFFRVLQHIAADLGDEGDGGGRMDAAPPSEQATPS